MQVQFIGVPDKEQYLDMVCGSAAETLALLETAPWASVSKGSVAKLRAAGDPASVDITPTKRGVRVTISN